MSNVIDRKRLVCVSGTANNNKFYDISLKDDGTVLKHWGRVGARGQQQTVAGGRVAFESAVRQKKGRGYTEVDTIDAPAVPGVDAQDKTALAHAASQNLVADSADPTLVDLVRRLVAANKHQLHEASGGMITVNAAGRVTTPLGVIGERALSTARDVLTHLAVELNGSVRARLTEEYLRLVPQKVPARGGWVENWITNHTTVEKQVDLLDALDSTLRFARSSAGADKQNEPAVDFRYRVSVLDPACEEHARITEKFEAGKSAHHRGVQALRVNRIFVLEDRSDGKIAFETTAKRIRNVKERWHGSRAANILSILSKGLFVPDFGNSGTIQTAGRMFGNGIYGSSMSSKSANYSRGGVWSQGRDDVCFMFLADFAMGAEYRPQHGYSDREFRTGTYRDHQFTSVEVAAGTAGVINPESVVPSCDQINLKYLLELA